MRFLFVVCTCLVLSARSQPFTGNEISRWEQTAKKVTIIRDKWGIPHIYGKTDADCVFGLMYAQGEDDFKRVERNYLIMLGRLSEVTGEKDMYEDVLVKMVIDSAEAVRDYHKSPQWLKQLLNAWADGLNYYLFRNPSTVPERIFRFKPWYPLMYTDGSISAIQTGDLNARDIRNFYEGNETTLSLYNAEKKAEQLSGSNGFAIAPSISKSGHAMLYINPHVTFYFRPEVHMVSEEGLNAYGAVTWGQFFVYQGFNEQCGWMHTSSDADVADLYSETISERSDGIYYRYDNHWLPVKKETISIGVRNGNAIGLKEVPVYRTHHGPVMAKDKGRWISVRSNNRSLTSLIQSWQRTKARSFDDFKKVMSLVANNSNNTVYADAEGNIAYWHGNFMPKRKAGFDWSKPVDGSIRETEWQGLHKMEETVHLYNPENGWIQNCNSTPFTAAGPKSPRRENYPTYMAPDDENFRGINAVKVLSGKTSCDLDDLIAVGYDTYLTAFDMLLPSLFDAWTRVAKTEQNINPGLMESVQLLRDWDRRSGEGSVATTLAILWGEKIMTAVRQIHNENDLTENLPGYLTRISDDVKIKALLEVIQKLNADFGSWKIPWGEINRYQRLDGSQTLNYDDAKPSLPVGFASSAWGSLPSYASRPVPGAKKRYGYGGNSFICAVEFGKKIKAKSLLAGGQSGNPGSPHFNDQALMYTKGRFKEILFYKDDIMKNAEKNYHPGE